MDNKELEIVAQGEFFDQGYRVVTIVVRLIGQDIRQQEFNTIEWNNRCCYETEEEWQEYKATKAAARTKFKERMRELLELQDSVSFTLTGTLSEIFTAVAMYPIEDAYGEGSNGTGN